MWTFWRNGAILPKKIKHAEKYSQLYIKKNRNLLGGMMVGPLLGCLLDWRWWVRGNAYFAGEIFQMTGRFAPIAGQSADVAANRVWGNTLTVYQYDGIIRRLIHGFKYNDMPFLGRYITRWNVRLLKGMAHPCRYDYFCSHSWCAAQRKRFDPIWNACWIDWGWDGYLGRETAFRIKNTPPQYNLSKELRKKNIKGAFRLEGNLDLRGKRIILIDDILTTGATMAECAAVLEGGRAGGALCFCQRKPVWLKRASDV